METIIIQPVILNGKVVRLEPLSEAHAPDLGSMGLDEEIWRYLSAGGVETEEDLRGWIRTLLARQTLGTDLPFAVILQENGRAIGATRYLDIQPENRSLEIGGTWYARAYQGTAVNPECKFLLLEHAFEELGMVRVQFKTDLRNLRSQRAIERLGAVREGVLRNHKILPDGYLRSSVYYSILAEEWPAVRAGLLRRLSGE